MSRSSSTFKERIWERLTLADDYVEFREYHTTWLLRLCRRLHEAVALLLISVPALYQAFVIRSEQRSVLRATVQFSFGLFLGLMFYLCVLVDLYMDERLAMYIGICIALFLAIGNVVSSQIRCISLLVPIRFGTATGRNVIMAMALVYLTAGPISNITANLQEALRVIICQLYKTFTLTKNRFELMFQPLGEAFVKLRANTDETKDLLDTVASASNTLQKEIISEEELAELKHANDALDKKLGQTLRSLEIDKRYKALRTDDNSTSITKNYARKLSYRCENLISLTTDKCRGSFQKAQGECEANAFFGLKFVCTFLDIENLCNMKTIFGGANTCHPKDVIPSDLGRTYTYLQQTRNNLTAQFQEVKLQYKLTNVTQEAKKVAKDVSDTVKIVAREFTDKKGLLETMLLLVTRIAAFSFLLVIFSCSNYMSNYITDVEEDNTYITWYFRKIDYRRFIKGKFTLLPLKTGEKRDLTDVYKFHLTTSERAEFLHGLIGTLLMLFFTLLFIIFDHLLYGILEDIRIHGNISYEQIGHHDISLQIKGVGFLSSILRSIAHSFEIKKRVKKFLTNEECLPRPSPPGKYDFKIFATFFLLLNLSWMNVWVLKRMCRYICSVFYPKVEKNRIIFLYNQTLKKRITYLNYRLDIVRKEAREKKIPEPLTFPLVLRIKRPRLFSWLLYFNQGRRSCIICNEPEPKSGGDNQCALIHCYLYYCQQCWDFVVKRKCIGCPKYVDDEPLTTTD